MMKNIHQGWSNQGAPASLSANEIGGSGTGILPVQFLLILDGVFQGYSTLGFMRSVRLP